MWRGIEGYEGVWRGIEGCRGVWRGIEGLTRSHPLFQFQLLLEYKVASSKSLSL